MERGGRNTVSRLTGHELKLLATRIVRHAPVRMAPEGGIGAEALATDAASVASGQLKAATSESNSVERRN